MFHRFKTLRLENEKVFKYFIIDARCTLLAIAHLMPA